MLVRLNSLACGLCFVLWSSAALTILQVLCMSFVRYLVVQIVAWPWHRYIYSQTLSDLLKQTPFWTCTPLCHATSYWKNIFLALDPWPYIHVISVKRGFFPDTVPCLYVMQCCTCIWYMYECMVFAFFSSGQVSTFGSWKYGMAVCAFILGCLYDRTCTVPVG